MNCSFCGKSGDQVKKLIVGPSAYIRDECVKKFHKGIAEESEENDGSDI